MTQHPTICRAGGNSQKPLLGKSMFEPIFDTGSCWLRIRNTKLCTQTLISFAIFLSFSLFPTKRKSWRQWKNTARNRWNKCMVSKHHINCRIHAWFHTRRRCVLEKLRLIQIVRKCKASLHVYTSPLMDLSYTNPFIITPLFWTIYINITIYKTTYFTEQHFCISPPSCVLHTPPDDLITPKRSCKKYKSWNCLSCTFPHPDASL